MAHPTYTLEYDVVPANQTPGLMQAFLASIARDASMEALLGLTLVSDVTTIFTPTDVGRQIVYQSTGAGVIPEGAPIGDMLANWYTSTFEQALSTPVIVAPVVVV